MKIPRLGIWGTGTVGAFGAGVGALRRGLAGSCSEPRRVPLPAEGRSEMISVYVCETPGLEAFVPRKTLRRFDHFSRLAILGAALALEDAAARAGEQSDLGVVIATGYGVTPTNFAFLDSFLEGGDPLSSPTLFSHSVHNAGAGNISIALGCAGPNLTVSQFEMSVFSALLTAARWIAEGRVDRILFGALDVYCQAQGYSRRRFFGPEGDEPLRPLALDRHTAVPGEGAAFFLLAPDPERSAPYGAITGILQKAARDGEVTLPNRAVCFLGADGHRECGASYLKHLPAGREVAAYAPLYGSLPVGPALALAVAALCFREGCIFPSPRPGPEGHPWREITVREDLRERPICCLAFGPDDQWGAIELER